MNRRRFIQLGISGLCGLTAQSYGLTTQPKAKSVIWVFLWGGMSHSDSWNCKEDGGYEYNIGISPLKNSKTGCFSEFFPLLDSKFEKLSVINSMTHGNFGHETAAYLMLTGGHTPGERLSYPSIGSVFAYSKRNEYKGILPPFIVLTQPTGRFSEEGFLGPKYKPFATGGDPNGQRFEVEGVVAKGITNERQITRKDLRDRLDTLAIGMRNNPTVKEMSICKDQAYEIILGKGKDIFDLSKEKDELRDRYGRNTFGQDCLAARRIVESGVPFILINYPAGWDTHKGHSDTMRRQTPNLDQGLSTLLQDLSDRGLLESTIVICCGEFGRTPKADFQPPWTPNGRGHYGNVFSVIVAGGGFKGGQIVGKTDDLRLFPKERPVYPRDLAQSIYELAGIDGNNLLPHPLGIDAPILPRLSENGVKAGGVLREIM